MSGGSEHAPEQGPSGAPGPGELEELEGLSREDDEQSLYALAVARPIGLLVLFLTLIVVGLIAYARIPIQMLPSGMQASGFSVIAQNRGASAQENEEKVARVLEEQFRTLPDLESIWSSSGEDSVRLGVRFSGHPDMDLAKAELRDRIERARPQLPATVDRIWVWDHGGDDPPVMFFAVLERERRPETDFLIESRIQRRLEAIDGVSRCEVWGMLDDSVRILLDEDRVRAARLDLGRLVGRLMADNFAQPLGQVEDGGSQFLLRSDMRFASLREIEEYPIGGGLRLADIARVTREKTVRDRLTRIDGQFAYYGMVQKESSANVVEVGHALERAIAELRLDPQLSGNLGIEPLFNQARFIENSLASLEQTALWGGGLAVIVLFVFLRRVRMTLCVALAIPVAALLAVAFEAFTGGTFNVLTMTGLTLGIGMLVDNAVVVIESIARLRARGWDGRRAAVAGARDVGLAISLATLTSVVVFLPLIFMGEDPTMRMILGALGIPLCTSLLFSLLVALVFLPVIAARVLGARHPAWEAVARLSAPVAAAPVRALAVGVGGLRGLMHLVLRGLFVLERCTLALIAPLRWPLAALLLGLAGWQIARQLAQLSAARRLAGLGAELPSVAASPLRMGIAALLALAGILSILLGARRWRARPGRPPALPDRLVPQGASPLAWIQDANRVLLTWTLRHRLLASVLGVLAVLSVMVPVGSMTITPFGQDEALTELDIDVDMEANFTLAETSEEMQRYERFLEGYREELGFAHVVARFRPGSGDIELRWDDRLTREQLDAYRHRLREELPRYAGHRLRFQGEQSGVESASRQFADFQIRGPDAEALERYGQRAIEILERVPGLVDVSSPLEEAPEQVRLSFDGDLAYKYGVNADAALQSIAWALRGAQLPRYQEDGREIPFFIEYDEEELAGLDTLRDLEVFTGAASVPLSAFASIDFQRGPRQIFRWNGQTTFNVRARIEDPNRQLELVEAGYAALEALDLPRGFSLGQDDSVLARHEQEMRSMQHALLLAVVLVFLLMGILFESLLLPFSVLMTIPFAAVGALWTLFLSGRTMDSVGWIGVIILVGVVVNNGIVLIDKIHRLRAGGGSREAAIVEGAAARVRPILMTALTTVFGLLPMALGEAAREGIDYRALATCVAGGLAVSTFFTLWIVPLAYSLMEDVTHVGAWLGRRILGLPPREGALPHGGSWSDAPEREAPGGPPPARA